MSSEEQTHAERREDLTHRIHVLEAIVTATEQPHRVLDAVIAAADAFQAAEHLQQEFGFTEVQAHAVTGLQFRTAEQQSRRMFKEELERVKAELAGLAD